MRHFLIIATLLMFTAGSLCATPIASYTFNSMTTANGESVNAQALFQVTGSNTFTITLYNLGIVHDAGQLLSDLQFDLNAGSVSLGNSSGLDEWVDDNGVVTFGNSVSTGWAFGNTTGSTTTFLLCVICGNGVTSPGVQPAHTIISPTLAADVNGSITGNGAHNPFLATYYDQNNVLQGSTFNFSTSGALDTNNPNLFSNVFFSFSTTFGEETGSTGSVQSTPEPISMMLTGLGLAGVGLVMRRRQRRAGR